MEEKRKENKKKLNRVIRFIIRVFAIAFLFLILLVIAVNIPYVQTFIAGKVINSIKGKTGTEISLKSVKIALPNTVEINDLFLRDRQNDTLLYLHSLSLDVALFRLLRNEVNVRNLALENVVANIKRKNVESTFNFQFLVDVFVQDTIVKPDTVVKPGKPWLIKVNDLSLQHIRATFYDARGGTDLRVSLGDFKASLKDIDIGKQKINLNEILLKNTSVALDLSPKDSNIDTTETDKGHLNVTSGSDNATASESVFLTLNITAEKLTIENTSFRLDNNSSPHLSEGIDYQHMNFKELNAEISNIKIDSVGYRAQFDNLSVSESCGINIKSLTADAEFTDSHAWLRNLKLETSESKISGNMSLVYKSFAGFLDDLWNSETNLSIEGSQINANEAFLFVPFLISDPYIGRLKDTDIFITAKVDGKLNDLNIEDLELQCLNKTLLKSNFRIKGIPDMNSLDFDATIDQLSTNLTDVFLFVGPDVFAGLKMPPAFTLNGKARGKTNLFSGKFELTSAYGNVVTDAFYQLYGKAGRDTFNIYFSANNILAGTILADTLLKEASFSGNASGTGIKVKDISGSVHLNIHDVFYNAYTYKDIIIDGRIAGNVISANASSCDSNLNFKLIADADLREANQKYILHLNLEKANLKALNFSDSEFAVSTTLKADVDYAGISNAEARLNLLNTTLISDEKILPVKFVEIKAGSAQDSVKVELKSDLIDGVVYSNIPPESLGKTLQSAYKRYFGLNDTVQPDPGRQLAFNMDVHIPGDFLKMISPEFEALTINGFYGEYSTDSNKLSAHLKMPVAMYSGLKLDSVNLSFSGKNDKLAMDLDIVKLSFDTLKIENIHIRELIDKGVILSEINILDTAGKSSYLFANKIESGNGFFRLSFLPEGLILDHTAWNVPEGNVFEKQNDKLIAQKFVFFHDDQSVRFETDTENPKIAFDNFAIQNLINIIAFSGKRRLLKGDINGEVVFPVPGTHKFINADIKLNDVFFLDTLLGDLSIKIHTENDRMDIESLFENDLNRIRLSGDLNNLSKTPELNLNAQLNVDNLSRVERFSFGYLSEMKGKINGSVGIKGTTEKPEINGFVGFDSTVFRINRMNFLARINQERINLDQTGVHLTDFVIEDADSKQLIINGDILTTDFSDMQFDLHLSTTDFRPINSTVEDNPLFYGKLALDADVELKGDLKNPKLTSTVKINSTTDLTYALPGSELHLVTSEGVVEFINRSGINDSIAIIQGDYLTDSIISKLTGLDLKLNLEIDPDAKFSVDIDPKSGDYLTINGGAKLNIALEADGKQTITGNYEVKNGVYQLSFYGLVKKTFTIAPGSSITWSGRPMDADLDITAEYEVRTSSVSLVANETADMSDAEKQTFNKRLPYVVKLNMRGFLAEPEISFNIDLPERYLLTYPLIATKLASLNSEENVQDLNKQVFALLVTGSFMAENSLSSNSSSPSNVASTAARNSVNGILADQLNNVSSKYVTGVDLNFGLTSYEDFEESSGDIKTEMDIQVSKKLFNDRLTVEALGSFDLDGNKNSTTSTSKRMTNEFAVIYQLTESGEYKIRVYYEDAYDLFDGDISISGIAIIFEKELETLKRKKKIKKE